MGGASLTAVAFGGGDAGESWHVQAGGRCIVQFCGGAEALREEKMRRSAVLLKHRYYGLQH